MRSMRLFVLAFGLALITTIAGVTLPVTPASAVPPGTRAMWLWSRADPATVMSWATGHGVREIFVHVTPDLANGDDLPRLQQLKTRADAANVRLSALGGDPGWTFDHAAALAWQRTALDTGLFAGSHVDVEPYALTQWLSDQPGTVAAYIELLKALQADDSRPLEADVPFWYGTISTASGDTLADQVLAHTDGVTAMTYRDTATGSNSMTEVAADILARGASTGKPVRLAAETRELPDCPYCTFFEQGQRRMASTLSIVDAVELNQPAFAGIAIHHYTAWRSMRP
jgi:hypothetical protein